MAPLCIITFPVTSSFEVCLLLFYDVKLSRPLQRTRILHLVKVQVDLIRQGPLLFVISTRLTRLLVLDRLKSQIALTDQPGVHRLRGVPLEHIHLLLELVLLINESSLVLSLLEFPLDPLLLSLMMVVMPLLGGRIRLVFLSPLLLMELALILLLHLVQNLVLQNKALVELLILRKGANLDLVLLELGLDTRTDVLVLKQSLHNLEQHLHFARSEVVGLLESHLFEDSQFERMLLKDLFEDIGVDDEALQRLLRVVVVVVVELVRHVLHDAYLSKAAAIGQSSVLMLPSSVHDVALALDDHVEVL